MNSGKKLSLREVVVPAAELKVQAAASTNNNNITKKKRWNRQFHFNREWIFFYHFLLCKLAKLHAGGTG